MNVRKNKLAAIAALGLTGGLALSACGNGNDGGDTDNAGGDGTSTTEEEPADLSGTLSGSGASAQGSAQEAWAAGFMGQNPGVTVTYEETGSGTGREQFTTNAVAFAGTDAALDEEELAAASSATCAGGNAMDIPVYISPIAIVYNIEGVDELNLSAETAALIFTGEITKWNDERIAAENEGTELPDIDIVPVNRSDKSGTTGNFTDWLSANAPEAWEHGSVEEWPIDGTQSGDGTSGLVKVVEGANGAVGYADASKAGNLGTAKIKVGEEYVEYSAEAAAKAVEVSPREEGREENDLVIELDRTTTEQGVYPLVLVSYLAVCDTYEDENTAQMVKAYASYIVSEDGQNASAESAGSAPLSGQLAEDARAAVDTISAAN